MRRIPLIAARAAFTAIATVSIALLMLEGCAKHDGSSAANDSAGAAGATATTAATASAPAYE
jgi:hypothetical protein